MFCVKCGIEVSNGSRLCQKCSDLFMEPAAEPVIVRGTAAPTVKETGPTRNEPTVSALMDSLADGTFKKTSSAPPSMRPILIIVLIVTIALTAGAGSYWYGKHRDPVNARHDITQNEQQKEPQKVEAPFIMVKETDAPVAKRPSIRVVQKKIRKSRGVTPATKPAITKEPVASSMAAPVAPGLEASRKQESWLSKPPTGPYVTPPSMDPRFTGR